MVVHQLHCRSHFTWYFKRATALCSVAFAATAFGAATVKPEPTVLDTTSAAGAVVDSSAPYNTGYPASKAFDGKWEYMYNQTTYSSDCWIAKMDADNPVAYLVYKFNTATVVDGLRIRNSKEWSPTVRAPKVWTFEGSNDGVVWTVLDTRSGETGWAASEVRDYCVANRTAYEYYKFNCTANNGDAAMMAIMELQFLQGGVVGLTTVTSGSVTTSSATHNDYPARKAFDGITNANTGRWLATKGGDMFLVYKFNEPTRVNAISLLTPGNNNGGNTPSRAPKDWTFLGSYDGVSWTLLDGQSGETGWSTNPEERYYEFVNNRKYQYYKFNCTANNGATDYMQLMEMEFYYHNTGLPVFGDFVFVRDTATSYTLSVPLSLNDAAAVSYIVSDGATATTNAVAANVSEGNTVTGAISGLEADKTYQISVLAVNAVGEIVEEAGSVYTGDLTLGATSNALEATGAAGTVAISRANPDPLPLTVYYTITGAVGTEGATWEAPVAVTIPAGETTGYLLVKPLGDLDVDEDIEVTVALAAGNYGVPAEGNSATLTIVNSSDPVGYEVMTIVNALDNPSGDFFTAAYGSAIKKNTGLIVRFAKPEDAPSGLRMFSQYAGDWVFVYSGENNVSRDWMLFPSVVKPSAGETVTSIPCVTQSGTIDGLRNRGDVRTFAGSWYIPADGIYSFRMHMLHVGIFSLDGKLVLRQATTAAVTTNNVELTAGWHSFYAAFASTESSSNSKIGPASGESLGFSFSASNAELTQESPGSAFEAGNGHLFSTCFTDVLIPSIWAEGGDVVVDCSNIPRDLRVTGQLASTNHVFKFTNLPSGRTLEVGRPAKMDLAGWQSLEGTAYLDWTRTIVPSGVNIRFEGSAAIDGTWTSAGRGVWSDGDHSAFSLGKSAILFVDVPGFFGTYDSEFHYPDGLWALQAASPSVLGDTAKIFVPNYCTFGYGGSPFYLFKGNDGKQPPYLPIVATSASKLTFLNDVEVGTGASLNKTLTGGAGDDRLYGDVNGASVRITGYSSYMKLCGRVTVKDAVVQQLGCRTSFMPPTGSEPSSITGTLTIGADIKVNPTSTWVYGAPTFCYCPETPGENPLFVNSVYTSGAQYCPENVGTQWNIFTHTTRQGSTLSTCSNNTVNVKQLTGLGVHLSAQVPLPKAQSYDERVYQNGAGPANFVFGEINGNNLMPIFVSSNVNITVTNIVKTAEFHYEVMSNGVNEAFLDIENSEAAGVAGSTITATDVAMLPGRIKGFTGSITLTETNQTETVTYPVVYDFDRGVAIGGCDGSGTLLSAPENGHIELSFVGTPERGVFGVLRFDDTKKLLDNWTISAQTTFYRGCGIELVHDANGFSFKTSKGFKFMLR